MALRGAWSTEHRAQSTGHRAQSFKQATGYRPELINSRACSLAQVLCSTVRGLGICSANTVV